MSNRRELLNARRDAEVALLALDAIQRLPRRRGSLVMWSNGVVWRRLGDDQWEPLHRHNGYQPDSDTFGVFPSKHVATGADTYSPWRQIRRLPSPGGK